MKASRKQKMAKNKRVIVPGSMVTAVEPWLIPANKCALNENIFYKVQVASKGLLITPRTKPGTLRITNTSLPNDEIVKAHLKLGSNHYLASDDNVYYLDGSSDPQLIGAVSQAPMLLHFAGYCVVLDGGYAKYIDPDNSHAYATGYDAGGYMWNWLDSSSLTGAWSLYSGSMTRAGFVASSPAWGPGSISLDTVVLYLSKVGAPTGNITIKIFDSDGTTLLDSDTIDATTLSTDAAQFTVNTLSAATAQSTSRYVIAEYSDGDVSNYVKVHYVSATGGKAVTYTGSWSTDTGKNPNMAVGPGLAPMASCGVVSGERLKLMGGGSTDSDKSKTHYSDANNFFQWGGQTYQGGSAGWIGVGRPAGGYITQAAKYYENLIIMKGGDNLATYMFSGKTPGSEGDFNLDLIYSEVGAVGLTLCEVGNNVIFMANDDVLAMEAIPGGGFGNIRKDPKSDDISNLIKDYGDTSAFAAYNRKHDQYFLKLNGLSYTLVFHVMAKSWVRYSYPFTPSMFSFYDDDFYIGATNGHLYKESDSTYQRDGYVDSSETGSDFQATIWGAMLDMDAPNHDKDFKAFTFSMSAKFGAQLTLKIKTDYSKTENSKLERTFLIPLDDDVTKGELDAITKEEWIYPKGGASNRLARHDLNFNARLAQFGLVIDPGGSPVYLGTVHADAAILGSN